MKYALLIPIIFGLATALSAQEAEKETPYSELVMLRKDLQAAQSLVSKLPDSKEKSKLCSTLARADRRSARLQKLGVQGQQRDVLTDTRHEQLVTRLKKTGFDKDKLKFLKRAFGNTSLTCAQGKALIQKVSNHENQFKAALILYPRLRDRENIEEFLEGVSYLTTRRKLKKTLRIE